MAFIIFLIRRKSFYKEIFLGLSIWFIFDVLGAFSTGTYYNHQFKEILPSFSIFSGFLLYEAQTKFNLKFAYVFIFVCLLLFPFNNMASLGHFYKVGPTKVEKQSKALGIWLQQNSSKDDAIFIWGGELCTRALAFSKRQSPSKYFDLELLGNQKSLEEFKTDVLRKKPLFILSPIEKPENMAFLSMPGWLKDLIRDKYKLENIKYGYYVYKVTK
jgi:hypothetical protein